MTREVPVDDLLKLPPGELKQVLDVLVEKLVVRQDLELAREIIEQYRPALEELASSQQFSASQKIPAVRQHFAGGTTAEEAYRRSREELENSAANSN
ncbi:hypothetical protein G7K71_07845 [Desulfofundulus sp. TPOSR]|uniref:hypothetical protein n=1 Tax=Desulfofundulus sp. TPOSR TaxID=2714340 RepID=UPI00140B86CF|nr:hypothetical protein [Desulfofundulus sp. TPOSR]NHM26895.1 hypothetical protein [Desulfofundulus sp. TPOSR]